MTGAFLQRAATAARVLADGRRPLRHMRWFPAQSAVLCCPDRYRLFRAGNQVLGKTTVGLAEVVFAAEGRHPFRPSSTRAGEYWVICSSWSQSVAIQNKLAALLDWDRVHPATVHDELRGFRGKNPAVRVRHEDGRWSTIRFKTTRQGTLNLASATIDGALFDEPPPEAVYSEVRKRCQARNGWVLVTLTPVGAPVDYLRLEVAEGRITDLHAPLTPDALIQEGSNDPFRLRDGTVCDAAWIARVEAETPAHEVPVRVHGEWEMRVTGRYFTVFRSSGPAAHVQAVVPQGQVKLLLGVDHGTKPGKQIAVLVAVVEADPRPKYFVIDEYVDAIGTATPEDDAFGILEMLGRHGQKWSDLSQAWGDRVHMKGKGSQKSNRDLAVQIARQLKLEELDPPLRTVKRGVGHGAGSLSVGSRHLYHAMVHGTFFVHPRCMRLIQALDRYTMADDDWKDPVDALRYAVDSYIFGGWRTASPAVHHR